jgi:hypothetical protein
MVPQAVLGRTRDPFAFHLFTHHSIGWSTAATCKNRFFHNELNCPSCLVMIKVIWGGVSPFRQFEFAGVWVGKVKKLVYSAGQSEQGCQMVYFQTKNPKLGKFWRASERKMFPIGNILRPFGINILCSFGNLEEFGTFSPVWVYCVKKNLATLSQSFFRSVTSVPLFCPFTREPWRSYLFPSWPSVVQFLKPKLQIRASKDRLDGRVPRSHCTNVALVFFMQ